MGGADQVILSINYEKGWIKSVTDTQSGKIYSLDDFIKYFPHLIKK